MTTFDVTVPEEPSEGAVVLDCENTVWQREDDYWGSPNEDYPTLAWQILLVNHGPLVLLWDGAVRPS